MLVTRGDENVLRGQMLISVTVAVLCLNVHSSFTYGFVTNQTHSKDESEDNTNSSSEIDTFNITTSTFNTLAITNTTLENDTFMSDDFVRTNNSSEHGSKCDDCGNETDSNATSLVSTGTDLTDNVTTQSPNDSSDDNVISKTSEQSVIANFSAAKPGLDVLYESAEYNGSEASQEERNSSDVIKSDLGGENYTNTDDANFTLFDTTPIDKTTIRNNTVPGRNTTSVQYDVVLKNKSSSLPPHSTILKHHSHPGPHKHGGRHRLTKQQYEYLVRHFTGFMPNVRAGRPTPGSLETELELDDGPFGSILWRDKKYLVTVLIPIGVGITGAMLIIVMAYATRVCRRRKVAERNPRTLLQPSLSRPDDIMLLEHSSDDEF